MPSSEEAILSPTPAPGPASTAAATASKRPPLLSRHSSSTHVSQSPVGPALPRPGPARPHKHVVGHNRMGSRNPSFHRSLSKIKITPAHAHAAVDDDGPPTPKARHHRRTHSSGAAIVPQLPGSLGAPPPPSPGLRPPGHSMRRTNTSVALPRAASHAALKKNHSSSQLSRLGSSKNVGHAHKTLRQDRPEMLRRAHTQPLNKRHKSPAPPPDSRRRPSVHFNVGSGDDADENDDDDGPAQAMEGVDDQWTEDSASASPNTTRDNTRNNTRQNSIILDPAQNPYAQKQQSRPEEKPPDEAKDGEDEEVVDDEIAIAVSSPPPTPAPIANLSRTRDFAVQDRAQQSSHLQAQRHHQQQQQENDEDDEDESGDEDEDEDDAAGGQELDERHLQLQQLQRQRQAVLARQMKEQQRIQEQMDEEDDDDDDDGDSEDIEQRHKAQAERQARADGEAAAAAAATSSAAEGRQQRQPRPHSPSQHSALYARPLDTELISKRLLEKKVPAPPRISSISALANAASADPKSLSQTQNGNLAPTGANNTPVVSRFVGPEDEGGSKDATPRTQSGFLRTHSRASSISQSRNQQEVNLQRNRSAPDFSAQERDIQSPTTPSGARTPDPLLNNSRTQQKLWLQRGLSNIEASSQPHLPALLPTGRAQAMRTPQKGLQFEFVDREYAVVRRFHNTLLDGVERVRLMNGGTLPGKPKQPLRPSSSATIVNGKRPGTARSVRSVKSTTSVGGRSQRSSAGQKARVSFHTGTSPESGRQSPLEDDDEDDNEQLGDGVDKQETAAEIARRIWETDVAVTGES